MSKPKKILHLISGFGLGGAETILYRLLSTWKNDSGTTHVVVSLRDNLAFNLSEINIEYKSFDFKRSRLKITTFVNLFRYIKSQNPDLINAWMYHACLVSFLIGFLKIPTTWGIHHSLHDLKQEKFFIRFLIYICSWLADTKLIRSIIYVSNTSRIHHETFGYPPSKSITIPNGFDCGYFFPNPPLRETTRHNVGISKNTFVIGAFGRFHPIKNHYNLLSALAVLKKKNINFCALLVGDGLRETNEQLTSWIHQFNISDHVKLLGIRNDMPALYNALDVYTLSSNSESFPNVLGEAMATGIPCVSTDVGDSSLILENSGWIVPIRDPNLLAQAIIKVYELTKDEKIQASTQARYLIESRFSLNQVSNQYIKLYTSLIT